MAYTNIHAIHRPPRHSFTVLQQTFIVDTQYSLVKELGQGAYGAVWYVLIPSSTDRLMKGRLPLLNKDSHISSAARHSSGRHVAIKKLLNVFSKRILTKRALREVRLLKHLRGHKNITCLYDMDIVDYNQFNEIYLYEELMEADLAAIIKSQQPLTDQHYQSFVYQILCGLKYIHSANVLHRDLKPGNLLVNADCELKICDFGLARGFSPVGEDPAQAGFMTEYVATRWYRAPEIMLSYHKYDTAIDMWSVGCILAELLGGKPLFKGRDYVDQITQILHVLGTPSSEVLRRVGSTRAQEYINGLPHSPKMSYGRLFPAANPQALELLDRLLTFDPVARIGCEEALQHPYLSLWHDPVDEPVCSVAFDFSYEEENSVEVMKQMLVEEVQSFRLAVRTEALDSVDGSYDADMSTGPATEASSSNPASKAGLGMASRDQIMSPVGHDRDPGHERVSGGLQEEHPANELDRELAARRGA